MKRCPTCEQWLLHSAFYKNAHSRDGLQSVCKECGRPYHTGEYAHKINQAYYEKWHEQLLKRANDYAKEHAEERAEYRKNRYQANRAMFSARTRTKNQALKIAAFSAYGGLKCACCGETNIGFLTLDHINNDGAQHRKITGAGSGFYSWLKVNNYPQDLRLRVLCFNCNQGRRCNGGVCPHVSGNP